MLFSTYLKRYAIPEKWISDEPEKDLGIIVVIPSYHEPELIKTLESLESCLKTVKSVEVIIVVNTRENDPKDIVDDTNLQINDVENWINQHQLIKRKYFIIPLLKVPHKIAGPGYARKVGMDEAISRFSKINNEKGIIVSLDADTTVDQNYLVEIEKHWNKFPNTTGVSIQFRHPFDQCSDLISKGIIQYELHLRYYIHAQRFAGFPFAFQTVGSSFAVSARDYAKQGGMNKRKAGEDFYFLHKIIPQGNYFNLNSTCVYPSSRPSLRVPFGTGKTISEFIKKESSEYFSYNFQSFRDLKSLLDNHLELFQLLPGQLNAFLQKMPQSIQSFLSSQNFIGQIEKIHNNTAEKSTFQKAFFRWFDGFRLMKFVHFARDNFYPNLPVREAVIQYLKEVHNLQANEFSEKELLMWFREYDAK